MISLKIRLAALGAALLLSSTASADRQAAAARLELARSRHRIWRTVLALQISYLERSVPAGKRSATIAYYLGRAYLLAGDRARASQTLRPKLRADAPLYPRLVALWRQAAAGRTLSRALPHADQSPLDYLVAAERGFLLAWREGAHAAGHAVVSKAVELARRKELDNGLLRRCLAYTTLSVGRLAAAGKLLERLSLDEPERRLPLDALRLEDGQSLETELLLYAPELHLCRSLLAFAQAAKLARDAGAPLLRARALVGAGRLDAAEQSIGEEATGPLACWQLGLRVREWRHRPLGETFGPLLRDDPPAPVLREGARVLQAVLGRPALAVRTWQRLLSQRRAQEKDLTLGRFLDAVRRDAAGLGASLLACGRDREALFLLDLLYDKARRANLWEFDLSFLTLLGQAYLARQRYQLLIRYLYGRRTIPELAAAAAAIRAMGRPVQAIVSFDRQRRLHSEQSARPVELEALLFGLGETFLARPRPAPSVTPATRPLRGDPRPTRTTAARRRGGAARLLWSVVGLLAALSAAVWGHRIYLIRKYRF